MAGPFALDLAISFAAFLGHFAIAVWLFNRLHAVGWPRPAVKVLEKLLLAAAALVCIVFVFRWLVLGFGLLPDTGRQPLDYALWLTYAVVCWTAAVASLPAWLIPKFLEKPPAALVASETHTVDVAARLGFRPVHGAEAGFFAAIRGNELLHIDVQRKTLRLPNLPPELAGLSIAHLSDLHMAGQVGREYYDVVVEETNALAPDLIVITGDILEKERCLPWIPQTLGRLQARHGKYFILGNHEKRLKDPAVLRAALTDAGLVDLGGRCQTVTLCGVDILLAGTELPWFGAAPELGTRNSELGTNSLRIPHSTFRILLSHSPDQLPWARLRKFDLMLSGHNHGGQIRLPWLGALIVPSHFGWRYAGGLYDAPPTLLHVSRGLGGIHPIRLNCPPELALLVLRTA